MSMSDERLVRFNLAVQRSRAGVYLISYFLALFADRVGIIDVTFRNATLVVAVAAPSTFILHEMYRRRLDLRWGINLNPVWMILDVVLITWSVVITGGISSPWFVWYMSNAAAVAFVSGKRAAYAVCLLDIAAYVGALVAMGDIRGFDAGLYLALFRMLFLFGAAYFFLKGISDLQEKRLQVQQLRYEEKRQLEELSRLTDELSQRSRELADANRRIREADKLKSQFLATMSHELRTPLNSIIGFSEILVDRLSKEIAPRYVDFLRHIVDSGQHLLGIVNDVLDLSKIESGKMEIYPELFSLPEAIENVRSVMRGQAAKKSIRFEVDLPPDLPHIESDLAKFKQVLYNLLSNAVKFSPAEATVTITARRAKLGADDAITVSVIDRGIGIDREHQQIVFQEFRQVDSSVHRAQGGTGLGLALVKKFVEIQKGEVGVESERGAGSQFWFTLPLRSAKAAADPLLRDDASFVFRAGERVLVVEDDVIAYELLSRHLESAAYIPIRARHGDEALKLAKLAKPIAITLDLVLPGLDGWEVLKRLKSDPETRDIPVVIVSMLDNRELGLALGAHDYFVKPVDRTRLIARLREIKPSSAAKKPRLLVIDDDPAFHDLLEDELALLGYEVDRALDGAQGIEIAEQVRPDAIILDLMMPGMSGFEVAEALKDRATTAQIPILVMTAKDLTNADRETLHSKIAALVPKGSSAKTRLIAAIQQLERSAAPRV